MSFIPTPPAPKDTITTSDESMPFTPTSTPAKSGSGVRWGLLVLGVLLLILGFTGAGGYLTAVPDWVPTALFIGGGLVLLLLVYREWRARPKR